MKKTISFSPGKCPPHAIKGTHGARVVDELDMRPEDLWVPKPRFSAFFATGLEHELRNQGFFLCAVTGIATNFCVLATAMEALCHNFQAVLVEDCSTASSREIHDQCLDLYRRNPLHPLFRVMAARDLVQWLSRGRAGDEGPP